MMTVIPTHRPWFMLTSARLTMLVTLMALMSSAVVTVAGAADLAAQDVQLGCAVHQS